MTIRRQMYLSAWVSGAIVIAIFMTLVTAARQVDLALKKSEYATDINTHGISGLRAVTVDYILNHTQRAVVQWQQGHAALQTLLATDLYEGTDKQALIGDLKLRSEYLGELFPKLTNLYAARSSDLEPTGLQREVEARLVTQIMVATQDMIADAAQLARLSHERLVETQQRAGLIVSIGVITMALLIAFNLVLSIRTILNRLLVLQRGAEIIGAGDLTYRTHIEIDNEVGALSRAFDSMASKLAQAQAETKANTVRLEELIKEQESFSYSVSHDLRAPLRGIDGWSLALKEDYGAQLDETGRQYLDTVRAETQRMGHLIDDLLQLSRVTRSELGLVPLDLSALAQTVAGQLKNNYPDRQIEFLIEPGLVVHADARLLEIALINLLDNACKFTGTRHAARVEVGSVVEQDPETRAQRKTYFVRDNGVGFDMAHATKLFGAFQRLHAASEFPGTGIGLATVQRIVQRHGGRIWVKAQADQGATFYFTLGEAS